jgi:hypothetical protein
VFTLQVKYNKADVKKQNVEYTLPVNTQGNNIVSENITKNYVDEEIAEKDQVEEAAKTKQNAEYTLTFTTCDPILKNKTPNKFAKVYIARNRTEELHVEKQNAGSVALAAPKNTHAESKKIAVKVYLVRAVTEETAVEQLEAGNAALTATKDIENKIDVVFVKEKFEELNVQKQKLKT